MGIVAGAHPHDRPERGHRPELCRAQGAAAQPAMVVAGADVDAGCRSAVVGSLNDAGFDVSTQTLDAVPEGLAIDAALSAIAEGQSLLITLDLPPASFGALGVPAYGNLVCQARFEGEGGEASPHIREGIQFSYRLYCGIPKYTNFIGRKALRTICAC